MTRGSARETAQGASLHASASASASGESYLVGQTRNFRGNSECGQ
jgi:hypothetical protein